MKQIDLDLAAPKFLLDAEATRQMAAYTAKLQDILKFIVDNLQTIKIVASAPVSTNMDETGDESGNVKGEIVILHNATQTNRRLYYKYQGSVFYIESD